MRLVWALVTALIVLSGARAETRDLTPSEHRGRSLFQSGPIGDPRARAVIGVGDVPVMATAVPCASCHGADGRGRPEGGVTPPDITWPSLSGPRVAAPGRLARPGYDAAALVRAITLGIDPGGNRLDPVMPRFAFSRSDAESLVAFLQRLGTTPEPGIEADAILIGTVQRTGQAPLLRLLDAYFQRINRNGAIFGREIRMVAATFGPRDAPSSVITRLLSSSAVLCLVAPDIAGDEAASVGAVTALGVPLIGPLTLRPRSAPASRYVFNLDGGTATLGGALATYAVRSGDQLASQIVDDGSPLWHDAAEAASAVLERAGIVPARCQFEAGAETCLAGARGARLFWFADGPASRAALDRALPIAASVLLPAALARDLLDRRIDSKVSLAFPEIATDVAPEAAAELRELAVEADMQGRDQAAQRRVIAAAKLLTAALEHAGRNLTREGLISAIEGMQNLRTGLVPRLSFTPLRHIGSSGAWVVSPGGGPPEWIEAP
jgi:ABC-type branched-subunit amino acid transport system substrate-binding protein